MLLVGTDHELLDLDGGTRLAEGPVTALAGAGSDVVALLDRQRIVRVGAAGTEVIGELAELGDAEGQSLVVLPGGTLVVGLPGAHLVALRSAAWETVTSFEDVPGRDDWHNPGGRAPDTRTLAVGAGGNLWVNVHVGGLWSSEDGGGTWRCSVEPAADVHEVVADDTGRVAVAAAIGFGWSSDGGITWSWTTEGLHGSYLRAVALDGESAVVTASTGPFSTQAAVYTAQLGQRFERCEHGLPDWFPTNLDTGCVAIAGPRLALGTREGTVHSSEDGGATWDLVAKGLEPVRVVQLR